MCRVLLPLKMLPMKQNRVLLINEVTRKFFGNSKVVAEHLTNRRGDKLEIYYVVDDEHKYGF